MTLEIVRNLSKKTNKEYTALILNTGYKNIFVTYDLGDMLRLSNLSLEKIDNLKLGDVIKVADVVKVK